MIGRLWMGAARAQRRMSRATGRGGEPERLELVRREVRRGAGGRSFADIGCMWSVHGQVAFAAEEAGAEPVTGLDVMPATPQYEAEHARRHSRMRLVAGDMHDPAVMAEVGEHDIVWCSGVIYHWAHPFQTVERLATITTDTLILASETIPEVPGLAQACVFLPGLPERDRAMHRAGRPGHHVGLSTPFDPAQGFANWWWGLSASALVGMVRASGLEVVEVHRTPFHATIIARRSG